MKKIIAELLCLALVLALFAGCGAKPVESTPDAPAEQSAETAAPAETSGETAEAKTETASETKAEEKTETKTEEKAETKTEEKTETKTEEKTETKTETTAPAAAKENLPESCELQVGVCRIDITPEKSIRLGGMGNTAQRMSTDTYNALTATVVAFTDELGSTAILITADYLNSPEALTARIRESVSSKTGVAKDRIMFCATHNHSGPSVTEPTALDVKPYLDNAVEQIGAAAKTAMDDRAVAEMYIASNEVDDGLNFVRRYLLNSGEWLSDNYNSWRNGDIKSHESEPDRTIQVIKFTRGGKKDVLLCNWQVHPKLVGTGATTHLSSDFVEEFRREVESELDNTVCVYFTGASGNLNPTSRIKGETYTQDYIEYGEDLAWYVYDLDESAYTKVTTGPVQCVQEIYAAETYRPNPELINEARQIYAMWEQTNDLTKCMMAGKDLGIHSPYHASSIIKGISLGPTKDLELNAISIGDVAFITAPYEMFDTNGMEIKDQSPFDMTFVCTCANGTGGYVPSDLACEHEGYENDCTQLAHGTGGLLRAEFVKLLEGLHQ